jgi:ribose 5-phosphate isomerase B
MRIGIVTDHGGFGLKEEMVKRLTTASHEVIDLSAYKINQEDDYPDFVIPLAKAVVDCTVDRGVVICGSGVGASVCANKIAGVRAALIHDHFSARQGVEDDNMNILCMGGRTVGAEVAWDLIKTFLAAECSHAERHMRRLTKVALLEKGSGRPPVRRLWLDALDREWTRMHANRAGLTANECRGILQKGTRKGKSND